MVMGTDDRGVQTDPSLNSRYQFWTFGYSTGDPIPYSVTLLRRNLDEARRKFDPEKTDSAFDRMVLVGHSMGGLLVKMMVVDTGTRLWRLISDQRFEALVGEADDRALFRNALFFDAYPEVRRVIFIATPHQGSRMDRGSLQHLGSRLLRIPDPLRAAHDRLIARNQPAFFKEHFRERIPTSIDELAPGSPILTGLHDLSPVLPSNIIRSSRCSPTLCIQAGPTASSHLKAQHLEGAASEQIVSSGHLCQEHAGVIDEVRRILVEHERR